MAKMLCIRHSLIFTLSSLFVTFIIAYPTGAPVDIDSSVCEHMTPEHGARVVPQSNDESPYYLLTNSTTYGPNQQIQVVVQGSLSFKGFLLEARKIGETDVRGTFSGNIPGVTQLVDCTGNETAVTHVDSTTNEQLNNLSLTWNAPKMCFGDLYFVVTIVSVKSEFWVALPSITLTEDSSCSLSSTSDKSSTVSDQETASKEFSTSELTTIGDESDTVSNEFSTAEITRKTSNEDTITENFSGFNTATTRLERDYFTATKFSLSPERSVETLISEKTSSTDSFFETITWPNFIEEDSPKATTSLETIKFSSIITTPNFIDDPFGNLTNIGEENSAPYEKIRSTLILFSLALWAAFV